MVELVSGNSRETEYEVYYQILSSLWEEEKKNVTVNCIGNESEGLPSGTISSDETKELVIVMENKNDDAVTIEIGCQGGLVGRDLVLEQGESIPVVRNFAYTGTAQTYTFPETGTYRIELWGASGGVSLVIKED